MTASTETQAFSLFNPWPYIEQIGASAFQTAMLALVHGAGWRIEGEIPKINKGVIIFVPHTSNWDFVIGMPLMLSQGVSISWIGKHTLFETPILGSLMRKLGGIPVERSQSHNMVSQLAQLFQKAQSFVLVLAPEGTRSWAPHWKSGFYHIAQEANVPIYPAFLDFKRKVGGVGPAFYPTGDLHKDMDYFRGFYADKTAKYPEHFGPVRLREEVKATTAL